MTGMDTRIGYPTEHLANTNNLDNLASPMFATGIGLVLNGFQTMDRLAKERGEVEQEEKEQDEPIKPTTHSDVDKRGKFFDKILKKTRNFFDDNDDN